MANDYGDPNLLSNYTWDQLISASKDGSLAQAGFGDIKYNDKTGKFDTPSWFNDHAVTLNKNASGGVTPYAEPANNGWIKEHKKELWTAAGLAAGGYGLYSAFGGAAGAAGAASSSAGATGSASGLLGSTSIAAMTPEAAFAGGVGTANTAVAGMGGAAGISAAGGGLASGGSSLLNSALKAGNAVKGLIGGGGGIGGGIGGGMAGNSTQTQHIDPRMAKYIYGDTTQKGILDLSKGMYDKNPDGMNDQMRQGLNSQWNTLNDPALKQGYQQMANTGMGLMNIPIAGNPFTNGMGGKPQASQQQQMPAFNPSSYSGGLIGAQPQSQSPFDLIKAGQGLINPNLVMKGT